MRGSNLKKRIKKTLITTTEAPQPGCSQTAQMETEWQFPKHTAKNVKDVAPEFKIQEKNKFEGLLEVSDVPRSGGRIPPIIMTATGTHGSMIESIKKFIKDFTMTYIGQNNVKIQCKSLEDFKKLRDGLTPDRQFHTFSRKEEKEIKSVVRGLPKLPEADIKDDIIRQGFPVTKVIQMKTKEPRSNATELYLVFFEPSVSAKKIKEIRYICYTKVSVVKYTSKSQNITQCFRCQEYGHAAKNCNRQAKCVKCAGTHLTAQCNQGIVTPAVCSGCSGSHPANFKDCPKRQSYLKMLESRKNRASIVKANPWKLPVAQPQNIPVVNDHNFPKLPTIKTPSPNIPNIPKKPHQPTNPNIQPTTDLTSMASMTKMLKILQEIRAKASGCTDKLELALMLVEYLDVFD
ncbi:uncharacterized protein LOC143919257 [Arctopsyche grandis]|uniref:uncharacterized protein LOC143918997 n=2 Tax=Arctopsyche grandis TaxID=121162 RepID=UPI00406D8D69